MSPSHSILGLHHVTAITGDAQKNLDFYTGVLGLRLVKLTVNFDDPTSYHLYYGDESGAPGTIMTFFVWPGAYRGRTGTGQVAATSFSIPQWSLSFWQERLHAAGVDASTRQRRFGDELIAFHDPDGLSLEIVSSHSAKNRAGGKHSPVPHEHAIRGFHGVTVLESDFSRADVLADALGLRQIDHTGERRRFAMADGAGGGVIDVTISGGAQSGTVGAGAVHHVALRVPDDAQQVAWLEELRRRHFNVSQVMDRKYFHSIYFRESGGMLMEIATDGPGFSVDEPPERLGQTLVLPEWLEPQRERLSRILPPLKLPSLVS